METADLRRFTQISEPREPRGSEEHPRNDQRDIETYAIIGAAMEVHRELRNGLLEAVYQDALSVEFLSRKIPFLREASLPVFYKGGQLPTYYKADFICFNTVLVEIKASSTLTPVDEAQVINYLKITGLHRAVLLNFGTSSLAYRRLVHEQPANLR